MRNALVAIVLLALVAGGLYLWQPWDSGTPEGPAALVGKPAPALKLPLVAGSEVDLKSLRGHVVVVDFWASWCPPCRASLPALNQLQIDMGSSGVYVLAVNVGEGAQVAGDYVRKNGLIFNTLVDTDGAVAGRYMVRGIPQTVVIGKDGRVVQVFVGFAGKLTETAIRQAIDTALKAK